MTIDEEELEMEITESEEHCSLISMSIARLGCLLKAHKIIPACSEHSP